MFPLICNVKSAHSIVKRLLELLTQVKLIMNEECFFIILFSEEEEEEHYGIMEYCTETGGYHCNCQANCPRIIDYGMDLDLSTLQL